MASVLFAYIAAVGLARLKLTGSSIPTVHAAVIVLLLFAVPFAAILTQYRRGCARAATFKAISWLFIGAIALQFLFPEPDGGKLGGVVAARPFFLLVFGIFEVYLIVVFAMAFLSRGLIPNAEIGFSTMVREKIKNPSLRRFVIFDFLCFRYAFCQRAKPETYGERIYFSRTVSGRSVQVFFLLLTLVELPIAHFIVSRFSPQGAWLLTIITVYITYIFWAEFRASAIRPSSIDGNQIVVRQGVFWTIALPLRSIKAVYMKRGVTVDEKASTLMLNASGEPNIIIHLKKHRVIRNMIGVPKIVDRLHIGFDEPEDFINDIVQRRI